MKTIEKQGASYALTFTDLFVLPENPGVSRPSASWPEEQSPRSRFERFFGGPVNPLPPFSAEDVFLGQERWLRKFFSQAELGQRLNIPVSDVEQAIVAHFETARKLYDDYQRSVVEPGPGEHSPSVSGAGTDSQPSPQTFFSNENNTGNGH